MIITTQTHTKSLTKILDKAVNQAEITQEEAIFLLKQFQFVTSGNIEHKVAFTF